MSHTAAIFTTMLRTPILASRPAPGRLTVISLLALVQLSIAPTAQAGGWLTGTKAFTPANNWTSAVTNITSLPNYNNLFFTDKIIVAATNNDTIRTPSTLDPISTVTGNNFHDETDLLIRGRNGLNFVFTRTYNSESRENARGIGYGWTHSYLMRLKSNDFGKLPNCTADATHCPENDSGLTSSITYTDERDGDHNYLVDESTGAVTAPKGGFDSLALDTASGQHTLTFRNGVKYRFEVPSGNLKTTPDVVARLKYIDNAWGDRLTLAYDANGRLSTVADNLGVSGRTGLVFTYDANGRLKDVSDWSARKWSYGFDAAGNLIHKTNPLNEVLTYTYWPDGRHLLNEIVQPLARDGLPVKTAFKYYQNGRAFSQTDSFGLGDTLDYDLYRKTTRVTDPRGGVRTYAYDANGGLIQLNEPDGGILQFANQADSVRYKKYDALGYATTYSYRADHSFDTASDTAGNVTREQDALGNTVDTAYGALDQIASVTDPLGTVSTTAYASATTATASVCGDYTQRPRETRISSLNGSADVLLASQCWNSNATLNTSRQYLDASRYRETQFTYEAGTSGLNVSQQQIVGQPAGVTITQTTTYDSLGRKKTETLKRRSSSTDATLIDLTTTYDYDVLDRVIQATDSLGNEVLNRFDANGQLWQVTHRYKKPDGTYDVRDILTKTFDAADRVKTETDAEGNVTRYQYDAAGNVVAVTDAEGHTAQVEVDAMNRKTAVIGATGYRTETKYNQRGEVLSVTNANRETVKFEYDALGRKTASVSPLGYRTEFQYDALGRLTCLIDANAQAGIQPKNALGCSESRSYDELGRVRQITDALDGVTAFTYDLAGNRLSVKDAELKTWAFAYDDLGRLKSETDHSGKTTAYQTDEAGNVYQKTNRLAETTRYTFDAGNRLTRTDYLKDKSWESQTYDPAGNLASVANVLVTYTYDYDPLGRPLSKTDTRTAGPVKSLTYTFDKVGNVLSKTTYQGSTTRYQYDAANRLVQLVNPDYLQVNYQYDPAGRMLSRIMSSGARSSDSYNADGQRSSHAEYDAGGLKLYSVAHQRDRLGRLTQSTQTDGLNVDRGSTTATYDGLGRLIARDAPNPADQPTWNIDETFSYDKVGNRKTWTQGATTRAYTYWPGTNRIKEVRQNTETGAIERCYFYDNEGRVNDIRNITSGTACNNFVQLFSWDAKGRLGALWTLGSGGTLENYQYDPADLRIGRRAGPHGDMDYYLEGEHLESVYAPASGEAIQKYFRGASIDELVAGWTNLSNGATSSFKPFLYHQDELNSTRVASGHNGGYIQWMTYTAFGQEAGVNPQLNWLKFTGREEDGTGYYYYRARYYSPYLGRFISEDPMGFGAGDVNFLAYVGNDPVNANDPSGNFIVTALRTAPIWGPALLNAGRAAWGAAATWARANAGNAGLVGGTLGGVGGGAGYYATTPKPTALGAGVATVGGVVGGALAVYAPGPGTFAQGAVISGFTDVVSQGIGIATTPNKTLADFNLGELAGVTLGGSAVSKFFGNSVAKLGPGWSEQAAGATVALPFTTAATAIGQKLGESPAYSSPLFNPSANTSFNNMTSSVILYPSTSNTSQMRSIYAKPH